jgi:cell division protein FtsN
MSEDRHHGGQNPEVEFERADLPSRSIFIFLMAVALGCVLVYFVLRGMYHSLDAAESRHQPAQGPLEPPRPADTRRVQPADIERFPQPRLESNERLEINQFRRGEEERLNSYGWVDQQAGTLHIPINRAIELVAQRGLSTRPQTGAEPRPDGNRGNQAPRGSDTSPRPTKQK